MRECWNSSDSDYVGELRRGEHYPTLFSSILPTTKEQFLYTALPHEFTRAQVVAMEEDGKRV